MSQFKYDRLEYVGKCSSVIVDIYPRRTQTRISKSQPYTFKKGDLQNDVAIKYYQSLYSMGVRLHESNTKDTSINTDSVEDSKEELDTVDNAEVIDESEDLSDVVSDVEVTDPEVDESVNEEDIVDNSDAEESINSTDSDEVEVESTPSVEATTEEMIEFLDLNYEDDTIKDLARDAGVKRVQNSWSKSTVIDKIIEVNAEYVINLMKNA